MHDMPPTSLYTLRPMAPTHRRGLWQQAERAPLFPQALVSIAATRLAGDKEVANAEAEWRQLLQLIQQDRKQRVQSLVPNHMFPEHCAYNSEC